MTLPQSEHTARWFIYALKDPRTDEVRYIGRTTNVIKRVREHVLKALNRQDLEETTWIVELLSHDLRPSVSALETGVGDGYAAAEIKWIAEYRARGANLSNKTDGGDGFCRLVITEQMRAKLKAARARRGPFPPELCAKMSAGQRRRGPRSPEFCAKMKEIRSKQAPMSEETRAKIADAHRNLSAEARMRMSEAGKRRTPISESTREKYRARMTGMPMPPEIRAKVSASQKGRSTCGRVWVLKRKASIGYVKA